MKGYTNRFAQLTNEDLAILLFRRDASISLDQDCADYRAMLARETDNRKFADCYERPAQYIERLRRDAEFV